MIQLGNNTITVNGISVFPDHADKNQFWYLPGPVQLARRDQDNRAAFTFIKFADVSGDEIKGKGFLMVQTNLKLDANTEREILSKLSAISPDNPKLTAVPFDEGTVECIALDLQGGGGTSAEVSSDGTFRAVEKILGGTVPSLHGNNDAAFSLSLSGEGATILESVFRESGMPIGALYNLKYTCLRPALDVEITANLKRVYDQFSAGLEAQVYFVRGGIEAAFEKLKQDGVIEIKVINYSTADDRKEQEKWALDFFKDKLLEDWFKPTLRPGEITGAAQAEGLDAVVSRGNQLRPEPTPAPPRPSETPQAGSEAESAESNTPRPDEGTGSQESNAVISNPPPVAENRNNAVELATAMPPVNTDNPAVAATQMANTLTQAASQAMNNISPVSFKLKFIRQVEDKTLTFKYTRTEAVQRTYAPQGFFGLLTEDLAKEGHFFEIDGDDAFFREFRVTVESNFDMNAIGLSSAHVKMLYGDENKPKSKDFIIDGQSENKLDWLVKYIPGINSYTYSVQYHFSPDSEWEGDNMSYDYEDVETEDRTLLVHPFDVLLFLEIKVELLDIDWELISSIEIMMTYSNSTGWSTSRSLVFSESNKEPQNWKIRSSVKSDNEYTYSVKYFMKDGSIRELSPVTTNASRVVITHPLRQINIDLVPLLNSTEVKMVFVDIEYDDDNNDIHVKERMQILPQNTDTIAFKLPVADDEQNTFRYQITKISIDNKVERLEPVETNETLIIIQ